MCVLAVIRLCPSSGFSSAAPVFPLCRGLRAVSCEIHLPNLTLLNTWGNTPAHSHTMFPARELWLPWVQTMCLQYGEASSLQPKCLPAAGGCTLRNAILCNRLLIFPEYLTIFWITKCTSAAFISTTHDFKSRNNIKLNFNDLSGEIGMQQQQKWQSDTKSYKMEVWQTEHDKKKKCIKWLQGPVMLAADTAGLLSFLLRCVISRENP